MTVVLHLLRVPQMISAMKRTDQILPAALVFTLLMFRPATAQSPDDGQESLPLDTLAEKLASSSFQERLSASKELGQLTVAQLDGLLTQTSDSDSSVRVLRELRRRYVSQALPSPGRPLKSGSFFARVLSCAGSSPWASGGVGWAVIVPPFVWFRGCRARRCAGRPRF